MAVNSSELLANAGKLDSKGATRLGVNGLQRIETESAETSNSPSR